MTVFLGDRFETQSVILRILQQKTPPVKVEMTRHVSGKEMAGKIINDYLDDGHGLALINSAMPWVDEHYWKSVIGRDDQSIKNERSLRLAGGDVIIIWESKNHEGFLIQVTEDESSSLLPSRSVDLDDVKFFVIPTPYDEHEMSELVFVGTSWDDVVTQIKSIRNKIEPLKDLIKFGICNSLLKMMMSTISQILDEKQSIRLDQSSISFYVNKGCDC